MKTLIKNELLLRHLLKAGKISDSQAKDLLILNLDKFKDKETIVQLVEKVGLPENEVLAFQLMYEVNSDNLLNDLLCRLQATGSRHLGQLFLRDLVKIKSWTSPRSIALMYGLIDDIKDTEVDEIVKLHSFEGMHHLMSVAIAICNNSKIEIMNKFNFWTTAYELILKNNLKDNEQFRMEKFPLSEFRKAISKAVTNDLLSQIIIDESWIQEFLKIGTHEMFDVIVKSSCWKKLGQKKREELIEEAGVSWNEFVLANKGLGTIRWKDIHPNKRIFWMQKEEQKLSSHERERFHLSLFLHEIDRLKNLKSFTKESVSSFVDFLTMYNGNGVSELEHYMGQEYYCLELFQSMPHKRQFELVFKEFFSHDIAYKLKDYCILTYREWIKLSKKFTFSSDLMITNTRWEDESPRTIKRAIGEI